MIIIFDYIKAKVKEHVPTIHLRATAYPTYKQEIFATSITNKGLMSQIYDVKFYFKKCKGPLCKAGIEMQT